MPRKGHGSDPSSAPPMALLGLRCSTGPSLQPAVGNSSPSNCQQELEIIFPNTNHAESISQSQTNILFYNILRIHSAISDEDSSVPEALPDMATVSARTEKSQQCSTTLSHSTAKRERHECGALLRREREA